MMKSIIRLKILLDFLLFPLISKAYDFVDNGIAYTITSFTDLECEVVAKDDPYTGNITIPISVSYSGKELTVTSIGASAFENNENILSVSISESVKNIGYKAFFGCSALNNATFNEGLQKIESSAFENCRSLLTPNFPKTLEQIGNSAFKGCSKIKKITLSENIQSVSSSSFQNCYELEEVEIMGSRLIGDNAFRDCTKLAIITLGEFLEEIGSYAFSNCGVKEFIIPNSVKNVGKEILANSTNLASLTIGAGITQLDDNIVNGCSSLEEMIFSDGQESLTFNYYCGEEKYNNNNIPGGWRKVSAYGCFDNEHLERIYIGRDLKGIDFYQWESMCLPFLGNTSIKEVTIGPFVTSLSAFNWRGLTIGFFQGCSSLSNIIFKGNNIETIQSYTFKDCFSLSDIKLPNSVTNINSEAFSGCSTLKEITFGYSTVTIGEASLKGCESLEQINFICPNAPKYVNTFTNQQYINIKIQIPTGSIESYRTTSPWNNFWNIEENSDLIAYFNKDGLKYEVLDNNNVEIIGIDYKEFTEPRNLIIQETVSYNNISYTLKSINSDAFKYNGNIIEITLPDIIQEIKPEQFMGCINLSKVNLSPNCTSIGDYAFCKCESLKEFICPKNLEYLGNHCFSGCNNLNSIQISENLKTLQPYLFENCFNLLEITSANSIKEITNNVFDGCSNLNSLVLNNVISIGNASFKDCRSLSSFTISTTCEKLGDDVFAGCSNLKEILFPSSLNIIGNNVFSGCTSLTKLTFESSNNSVQLGYNTSLVQGSSITPYPNASTVDEKRTGFRNCYYNGLFYGLPIEELVINRNIELPLYYERKIGNKSGSYETVYNDIVYYPPFYGLKKLKSVEIGENVTTICQNTIDVVMNAVPTVINYTNFGQCDNIQTVISKNPVAPVGGGFSQSVYENAILNLPNGGRDSYQTDEYWKNFVNIIEGDYIPVESISFEPRRFDIFTGETKELTLLITPGNATYLNILWESSNEKVVSISENGIVTGISPGWSEITATIGNLSAICVVFVTNPIIKAEQITLNLEKVELNIGETIQLEATVLPEDTPDKTVTWNSSNEEVASISENGLVSAISVGETIISATCGEVSAQCEVTVLDESGIESLLANPENKISIYNPDGILIKKDCKVEDLKTLNKGIYIIVSGKDRYKISL